MKTVDNNQRSKLLLQPAPFLKRGVSTPGLMLDVVVALVPVVLAALYYFGLSALLVLATTTLVAMVMEAVCGRPASLRDGSAALTGLLVGLTLPPAIPLWMAALGSIAAIGLGKAVWGGLGQNLFNPALVGRAFLQAAFPVAMTTWSPSGTLGSFFTLQPTTLTPPLMHRSVDMVTSATLLAHMKFEHSFSGILPPLVGNIAGSLGETSGALIILAGLYLAARRSFDWRIPASIILTVAALTTPFWLLAPQRYPSPLLMVLSGGLLFGAVYMATDPVTSPLAPRGAWLFGAGIGVLVVLIRLWGGLPEGVMYAILLMNAATPLIERVTQPRPFGREGFPS